jgi:pimeloyl-ACP methyl ester carboxylesterase
MTRRPESRFYPSQDGLRLHYLDVVPEDDGSRLPVVCLPGLTRGAADFAPLANALAFESSRPRRVVAFDYRGRGLSEHDPDWRHYDLATERTDYLDGLEDAGIGQAHFIGTSRGGLHVMALAARHRDRIASVVLNDIGPVLEAEGLRRIKGYVGQQVRPKDLEEAVKILKIGAGQHFDKLSEAEWRIFATTTFGSDENQLRLRYDLQLARTLDAFDLDKPLPDSWELFDLLGGTPLLTLRGSNSDLLSTETLDAMAARWPESESFVVEGQGHAPLLADAASIDRIHTFLAPAA